MQRRCASWRWITGARRIGLAIGNTEAGLAQPLGTLDRINRNEDMRRLRELVREHGVQQIVVGLPLRLDGTRGDMAEEAARFGQRVHKQMGLPVEMVDERLTSWEAERLLEEQQGRTIHATSSKQRKKENPKDGRGRHGCSVDFEGVSGPAAIRASGARREVKYMHLGFARVI